MKVKEKALTMMVEVFNISQSKVDELSSRLVDEDVELLIRHMNIWKENIDQGWLRDKDIPEAMCQRISRWLDGERPIVRIAKGKLVKVSECEYRYEKGEP